MAKDINALDYVSMGRISPNDFQKAKYTVTDYCYPSDLLGKEDNAPNSQYGNNYVIFFINVSEDSKIVKSIHTPTPISNENVSPRQTADIIGRNTDNNVTKTSTAGAAVAVGALSDVAIATLGIPIGSVGTKGGLIAGGALLATGDKIGSFTRPQKRLQTAIALHVPNQLSIRYGLNWDEEDTSLFSYATTGAAEIAKMVDSFKNIRSDDFRKFGSLAQDILSANVMRASSGVSASTGLAANPLKEQIFNGVNFRTFQMDYQFFPRNPKEADNVLRIIQQFKYHAHPEFKDKNNFIYIYPSEFDIAYYRGNEENKAIHRHTSCVLQSITVNYTPNGIFNTFENGIPTQINISLDFVELARLTKDEIREGF
jgi:hypothetical protein